MQSSKAVFRILFAVLCLLSVDLSYGAQPRKFLTFSGKLGDDWIKRHGSEYVFVWGESDGNTRDDRRTRLWAEVAPTTRLSSYFPYGRDPARLPPSEWLVNHPDWILYRCDGETMATLFNRPVVPLDIANPAVTRWQIANFAAAAHTDIALDNFATINVEHGCGVLRNGKYVELYRSGGDGQKAFAQVKVEWLERVADAIHGRGKTITVNYQLDQPLYSPLLSRIVAATDAILDEEVYPAHSRQRYRALARFASMVQKTGKALYTIYQLQTVTAESVQSAMAAYLINANAKTAIDITGIQQYGMEPKYFGYDKEIGEPCGTYQIEDGFYTRRYTRGLAVLRDPEGDPSSFSPEAGLLDVQGVPASHRYLLAPSQGLVLYRAQPVACAAMGPVGVVTRAARAQDNLVPNEKFN
jgi:hypothetical protein